MKKCNSSGAIGPPPAPIRTKNNTLVQQRGRQTHPKTDIDSTLPFQFVDLKREPTTREGPVSGGRNAIKRKRDQIGESIRNGSYAQGSQE